MRFLIDAQLPPALASLFIAHGLHAAHVFDLGMASASDGQIWDLASEQGWIIVTKDEDFALRKAIDLDGPAILWLRWPNTRRAELLGRFEKAIPAILDACRSSTFVELR